MNCINYVTTTQTRERKYKNTSLFYISLQSELKHIDEYVRCLLVNLFLNSSERTVNAVNAQY